MNNLTKFIQSILILVLVFVLNVAVANAQTTEFTYQGSLNSGGTAANGNFDFEFALFDAASGGAQVGTTQTRSSVVVTNGAFSVNLNFGSQFPGANRFLEIRVRQTGGGAFTTLAPRNPVTSSPYAVKSLTADSATSATTATTATNATQLGGVSSGQYVLTGDSRMTDARTPTAGSSNYIRNSTSLQQTTDFNISGSGRAGSLSALQYNIGISRFIASPGENNVFLGLFTGNNSSGTDNTFLGHASGNANTLGSGNTYVGRSAGFFSQTGDNNTFTGFFSGLGNNGGSGNSYFGFRAGDLNSGSNSTLIGSLTRMTATGLNYATALGAESVVSTSNTVVLGRPLDRVSLPGTATIGSLTTQYGQLNINAPSTNANFYMSGDGATKGINFGVDSTTPAEARLFISQYNGVTYLDRMSINENGVVAINVLGTAGSTGVCRNASSQISVCSSSLRYKTNINRFGNGLSLIKQLRPIAFDWKDGGISDLGLGAEDVAAIEPLLVTYNDKGEVEGVKYDRVGVVLVNAVQEQQTQIETQQKLIEIQQKQFEAQQKLNKTQQDQLETQQKQIDQLKQIVCQSNPSASICEQQKETNE